jgi:arginase
MPLATALGVDNLECKTNEVPQNTLSFWNQLKQIGGISPKINPEDLVFIGVRDTEDQEDAILNRLNIKNYEVADIRTQGVSRIVKAIDEKLKDCDCIYVSFDVDSMDPELTSHGTGTPVKGGLTPEEAKQILMHFANTDKTVCIEIVEVNPCLDEKKNTMAEVTLELVETITQTLKKHKYATNN